MAVIGKIRERAGLLIGLVGFSLVAFILGDLLTSNRSFLQGGKTDVAIIGGKKIKIQDFQTMVQTLEDNYKANSGSDNIDQNTAESLREQAWNQLLNEQIMEVQYQKAGLGVSSDELFDMVQGKNPHPQIKEAFKDPKTGAFSTSNVLQFLKTMDEDPTGARRAQWVVFEKFLIGDRIKEKYSEMIKHGLFTTSAEAKLLAENQGRTADIRYVDMLYSSIVDSTIKVDEKDLRDYYNANKEDFKQEASRKIEYVVFEITPSEADKAAAGKSIEALKQSFMTTTDDSGFVAANSDSRTPIGYYKKGSLSPILDSVFFGGSTTGNVVGPYEENGSLRLAKNLGSKSMSDSIKVSHALVSFVGAERAAATVTRSKEQAKAIADSLLAVIKKDPKQFDEIAKSKSDDAVASTKAGDLDWITRSSPMDPRFKDGAFETARGEVSLVESNFGYHLIKVTDQKAPVLQVKVAMVDVAVKAGSKTIQTVFNNANEFAANANTTELFEKTIQDKGYNKRVADNVREADRSIAGLESPRELIRWAYQAEKGDVSKSYEFGNKFVVAHLAEVKEKGIAPFDQAEEMVRGKVITDKKAAMFSEKFNSAASGAKAIDQLASSAGGQVKSASGVSFLSSYINNLGVEPAVVGTVFSSKQGQMSAPIKGMTGVYVIVVDNIKTPAPVADLKPILSQATEQVRQRSTYEVFNALKEKADITDNRGKFY